MISTYEFLAWENEGDERKFFKWKQELDFQKTQDE